MFLINFSVGSFEEKSNFHQKLQLFINRIYIQMMFPVQRTSNYYLFIFNRKNFFSFILFNIWLCKLWAHPSYIYNQTHRHSNVKKEEQRQMFCDFEQFCLVASTCSIYSFQCTQQMITFSLKVRKKRNKEEEKNVCFV